MKKQLNLIYFGFFLIFFSCGGISEFEEEIYNGEIVIIKDTIINNPNSDGIKNADFKILSLGDSYTIGQSVCEKCRFPEQLVASLLEKTANKSTFDLKIIARTGWTTSNLINAIDTENLTSDYNFVTLLIGVNNQYQNKSFSVYEAEFPLLVNRAISFVNGDQRKLVVVSIPDYAFTPFGNGNTSISNGVKKYNDFATSYCNQRNITFLNITDITQQGLTNPALVANDGLHPSKEAYSKFVERLLPLAFEKLMLK
jgi:lysophospholipase L1-like esterase